MSKEVVPYEESEQTKKQQVTEMFDQLSGKYDRLNRIISLGIDVRWREKVVRWLSAHKPKAILDIATGTGDLALALTKTGADRIVGLDIARGMLSIGEKKIEAAGLSDRIEMVVGDSEALQFPEASFDAVTVSFGVRNFENLEKGLQEIYRVLKPGGKLVILETSIPTKFPYKQGYTLYGNFIVPAMGRLFAKDKTAYAYLSKSAAAFPYGQAFNNILSKTGFIGIEDKPQTFGVATIYTATK